MKRILLALGLLCFALPAWAAAPVWIDEDTVVDAVAAPNVTSLTVSVTVSAGANSALVFAVSPRSSTVTVTGCTFNTTEAATFQKSELNATLRQEIWTLQNPTVTTANAVCTFSGGAVGARMSVHQYDDVGGFGAVNSIIGSSINPSVSVTTTQDDSVVFGAIFSGNNTASPYTPDSGTTERVDSVTGSATDRAFTDIEKTTTLAGVTTVSTTASITTSFSAVAIEIKAVSAGGAAAPLLTLLGVGGSGSAPPPPNPDCTIEMAAGATDAQIIAQLASAPDGTKLCIAAGETVIISNVLQMDVSQRALTLDCQGSTLQRNYAGNIILAQGTEVGTTTFSVSGQTLTFGTLPTGLASGDWVKLAADDALTGGAGASASLRPRLGQAVQIDAVTGAATATFTGTLNTSGSYVTNKRANKVQSKTATIRRCRILGDASQLTWQQPSIQVTNAITPLVEKVQCEVGLAGCINTTNTIASVARDIDCRTLTSGTLATNYCIHSDAAWNPQAQGVYADNTRKPFEVSANDIAANAVSLADYGAGWNASEADVVCRANNGPDGCFGFKSEAQNGGIVRAYGFASPKCVSASGINNTMTDSFCVGGTTGIELNDQVGGVGIAGDDGQSWLFDGVIIRELTGVGITAVNSPTSNRICSSRIETSGATVKSITDSNNFASCTYVSGHATIFNSILAANVTGTQDNAAWCTAGCAEIMPMGAGADTIDALGGDDLVWGGTGNDTITLGLGSDRLAYLWTDEGSDTVSDFTAGGPGDIIDVSWFLARAAGADYTGNPLTDGYTTTSQSGGDCLVRLDEDGTAGATAAVTVATLTGVTCANLVVANWRTTLR